ncbi:MAG TPA: YXWGXW repeat-containing protein [Thermoanaerobaculia bacterium]|jgi:hypothetical protein
MRKKILRLPLISAIVLAASFCAIPAGALPRIYVRIAPPTPPAEVRVVAPGPGHVWIGGYHRWDGRAYIWVPGRWVLPPRPHALWVPGHWRHAHRGWHWVEGHWR